MNQSVIRSLLYKLLLLVFVEVLGVDRIEVMCVPEGLSGFQSIDVIVGLLFLIVMLPVSVSYNVILSQSWGVNLLASFSLNSNGYKFQTD